MKATFPVSLASSLFAAVKAGARQPILPKWLTVTECSLCKRTVDRMTAERSTMKQGVEVRIECHADVTFVSITNEMIMNEDPMMLVPFLSRDRGPQLFALEKPPKRTTGAGLIGRWIRYVGLKPRGERVYVDAREGDGAPRLTREDGTRISLALGWAQLDGVGLCEPPSCALCGAVIVGDAWNFVAGIICGGDEPEASRACTARQERNSRMPMMTGADFGADDPTSLVMNMMVPPGSEASLGESAAVALARYAGRRSQQQRQAAADALEWKPGRRRFGR